jgi:hypothetical protein
MQEARGPTSRAHLPSLGRSPLNLDGEFRLVSRYHTLALLLRRGMHKMSLPLVGVDGPTVTECLIPVPPPQVLPTLHTPEASSRSPAIALSVELDIDTAIHAAVSAPKRDRVRNGPVYLSAAVLL